MSDKRPYRVIVADDFMMTRQVFENAVLASEEYELAASYDTAEQAVEHIRGRYADLVIMDIVMKDGSNGLAAAKKIKDIRPETKIIMVTSMPEVSYIGRAKEIGVESFWYKEVQEQPILEVMKRTMEGESIYPENAPVIAIGNSVSTEFSEREIEVLRELTAGCSNKEIGEKLGMTERTVKGHIANMLSKTGFRSRLELAVKARTGGFVILD